MSFFNRVAASAAAVLAIVAGGAIAVPSQANDLDVAPVTSSYADHAVASIDASAFAADPTAADPAPAPSDAPLRSDAAPADALAATDTPAPARTLAAMVEDHAGTEPASEELSCLATAVYFESKGEPLAGQLAVAEVIVHRAQSGRFPSTLCGVVKQKAQFSFVRGGALPPVQRSSAAWRTAVGIAHIAQAGLADESDDRTMFFHARYVAPAWRNRVRTASIGNHIFYR